MPCTYTIPEPVLNDVGETSKVLILEGRGLLSLVGHRRRIHLSREWYLLRSMDVS
jgi:hypothetical protein